MKELVKINGTDELSIRALDKGGQDPIPYDNVEMVDLTAEVQPAVEVSGGMMEQKNMCKVFTEVERISTILGSRRKRTDEEYIAGNEVLRTRAISDVKQLGERFLREPVSAPAPGPAPAPGSALASGPIPAPGVAFNSAPSPTETGARLLWMPSLLEQRRTERLTAAGSQTSDGDAAQLSQQTIIQNDLLN